MRRSGAEFAKCGLLLPSFSSAPVLLPDFSCEASYMLLSVQLPEAKTKSIYFQFLTQTVLNFRPGLNVVVGPNATGKTSLLKFIENGVSRAFKDQTTNGRFDAWTSADCEYSGSVLTDQPTKVLWYRPSDFGPDRIEKMYTHGNNGIRTEDFLQLRVFRMSEAECAARYFSHFFEKHGNTMKNTLILVDEPELHNDVETLQFLMDAFSNWIQYVNVQIVAATHHPLVVAHADNVIELKPNYRSEFAKLWSSCCNRL